MNADESIVDSLVDRARELYGSEVSAEVMDWTDGTWSAYVFHTITNRDEYGRATHWRDCWYRDTDGSVARRVIRWEEGQNPEDGELIDSIEVDV